MPDAWSNTKEYLQGDVVTYSGHTYEWGSADPSRGVTPPSGSWVRLDAAAAAGGASPTTYVVLTIPAGINASAGAWSPSSMMVADEPAGDPGTDFTVADGVLTVVNAGRYAVSLFGSATPNVRLSLFSNGPYNDPAVAAGPNGDANITFIRHFNAGETLTLNVFGGQTGMVVSSIFVVVERLA
jgi:hypothetical protein